MRLTIYLALLNSAMATVTQFCERFETPNQESIGFEFNTTDKVTLLAYHEDALKSSNIPKHITDKLLEAPKNNFKICTSSAQQSGKCDEVGEFSITFAKPEARESVMNIVAEIDHQYFYPVSKAGISCYVVYSPNDSSISNGASVNVVHSESYLIPGQFAKIETLLIGFLMTVLICIYWSNTFGIFNNKVRLSTPHLVIRNLLLISYPYLTFKTQEFGEDANYKFPPQFITWGLSIILCDIIYNFSLNRASVTMMNDRGGTLYKSCLVYYTVAFFSKAFQNLTGSNSQIWQIISSILNLGLSIIWIPLFYVLYSNSLATESKFTDMVYAKSYSQTREALIAIPLMLKFLTWVTFFILSNSSEYLYIQGNVISKVSNSIISNNDISKLNWFSFIIHLDSFTVTIIVLVLLYIWKPKTVPKLEDNADLLRSVEELEVSMQDGFASSTDLSA